VRAVADTSGTMQAMRPHDNVESLIVVVVDGQQMMALGRHPIAL
jgi:hypothetical protein